MGWVDQWVGLGWIEVFQFSEGCVGLGPLQQNTKHFFEELVSK